MGFYGTRELELDDLLRDQMLRRSLRRRAADAAHLAAELFAQKARALLWYAARNRRAPRRRFDRDVRNAGSPAATTRFSRTSNATMPTTAARPICCASGCSRGAPRRKRFASARSRGARPNPLPPPTTAPQRTCGDATRWDHRSRSLRELVPATSARAAVAARASARLSCARSQTRHSGILRPSRKRRSAPGFDHEALGGLRLRDDVAPYKDMPAFEISSTPIRFRIIAHPRHRQTVLPAYARTGGQIVLLDDDRNEVRIKLQRLDSPRPHARVDPGHSAPNQRTA